ncbi:hypothetical protein [Acetilactobacillus jinshanensis]|uniref:Uncharacterized protein n=1 Tax=Acetilactobacillus jinshanensis TaxID=1720083 RepID=A0A4P6ZL70_9LACO|nr:hypothetical protein [Acetilactobacillus jinshanensis]QBP18277.1 hypothetical protein ELX58_03805 [Acetilactobacillus jinshanensis]URL61141.1 hypothetical protein HGK75_03860 [uncultured bacterium]
MKIFQIIYLYSDSVAKKQALVDVLLQHNLDCFGIGQHVIVLDEHPNKPQKAFTEKALDRPDIQKKMTAAGAKVMTFNQKSFDKFKPYLSKEYVFWKQSKTSMSYKSKTQHASFTIFHNGRIKTSKDLLDVALISNLVRICTGEKPENPQMSV